VEITPEREYLLVTEFFDGAVEIGDADIDDQVGRAGAVLLRKAADQVGLTAARLRRRDVTRRDLPALTRLADATTVAAVAPRRRSRAGVAVHAWCRG
jgi:hypothetical protein